MGYPSYLNKFFNQVKLVLAHYGIVHDDDVTYFDRERYMVTYFITASFGKIYIEVDTQMMNGTIQFDKIFNLVDNFIEYKDFSLKIPSLKKHFEAFLKDKEIFNAVVTDKFAGNSNRRTYGFLLDILDVSLIFKVSADDKDIDVGSFTIRYNKPMMWTQTRMLDKSETIPFEKNYDFNYLDGLIVYDGDYKLLHQSIMDAYDLNEADSKSICFKDLAQLTLMKIY
jgi:hypothetical protein